MTTPRFTESDHETWRRLYDRQRPAIANDIHPLFGEGLRVLEIGGDRIPEIEDVNEILRRRTGYVGRYVEGLEDSASFYSMLARGEFPVGNFIRDARDLAYTPAPDVFHDLFGHIPYLADPEYADFSRKFGEKASRYIGQPEKLAEFDRLYWFTLEFALIRAGDRTKVFGSGIASSFGETRFALSSEPEVLPFDTELIRRQPFRIDEMQKRLFRLDSLTSLYTCLDGFAA